MLRLFGRRLTGLELWKRNLFIVAIAQLLTVVGFSQIFPFLPLYVEELGVTTVGSVEFWSGMVFSAQAFTMCLMAPIWGGLADRLGRKLMVERSLFGGAICLLLMAFAQSAEQLTLIRAVQGMITGVIAASSALVAAGTPREKAGWALGILQTGAWAGVAIGPLIGGFLADTVGFRIPFYITATLLLITGFVVHFWVVETRDSQNSAERNSTPGLMESWKKTLAAEGMRAVYLVKFSVRLAATIMVPLAPLLVAALMPESDRVATFAGLFTASVAAAGSSSAVGWGVCGDRIGHRSILVLGCLISGVGYLMFLWVTSIWHMIGLAIIIGIANGAIIPSIGALLANCSPEGGQGSVYGIDASVNSVARMFSPVIGTTVATWFTLQTSFALAGVIFFAAAGIALSVIPRRPRYMADHAIGAAD